MRLCFVPSATPFTRDGTLPRLWNSIRNTKA